MVQPLALLPVVLLLGAVVPSAGAQTSGAFHLEVAEPSVSGQLPYGGSVNRTIDVQLLCDPATVQVEPVTVTFAVTTNEPWALATVNPAVEHVDLEEGACALGPAAEFSIHVTIGSTTEAPGGKQVVVTFTASVEGDSASVEWNESVAPAAQMRAYFEQAIWKAAPDTHVDVPLTVVNEGNTILRISAELDGASSGDLTVDLPDPFEVAPFQGPSMTYVRVRTPAEGFYMNDRHNLEVLVSGDSLTDPVVSVPPQQLTAVIQVQGTTMGASSPAAALVLVALAAVILVMRRPA